MTRAGETYVPVVHHGVVRAGALWCDRRGQTPNETLHRILPFLLPEDTIAERDGFLLLRFERPRALRSDHTPGLPLVEVEGLWTSFPLSTEQAQHLELPRNTIVWLEAGQLCTQAGDQLTALRMESWLDVGAVEVAQVRSLGKPTPIPEWKPPELPKLDLRRQFGVAELSQEAEKAKQSVQTLERGRRPLISPWVTGVFAWVLGWLAQPRSVGRSGLGNVSPSASAPLGGQWRALRIKLLSALGVVWQWFAPHERYLRRLNELFNEGDTLEALRHAIPLGDGKGEGLATPALAPPGPRSDLSIGLGARSPARVLDVGDNWRAHLRELYETSLRKLQRDGKIDEATFVLAELLRDVPRAIEWLERHRRYRLAAELAEAREQPVAECIRLWFLAGETERAVALSVRHGAFADVVLRLEKRDPDRASEVRMLWADRAARAGDFVGAARIAERVPQASSLTLRWLELATREPGVQAIAAWVMRLSLDPKVRDAAKAPLLQIIDDTSAAGANQRALLCMELSQRESTPELDMWAAPLGRALLHDSAQGASALEPGVLERLLERAPVLRADVPQILPRPAQSTIPFSLQLTAEQRGTVAGYDVLPLSDGRTLVALGELGVALYSKTQKRLVHWEREPVSALVGSWRVDRVITLGGSAERTRVGRLDLSDRRQERWFELGLSAWAPEFDGETWFVSFPSEQPAITCLDAIDSDLHVLWQTPTPGPVREIRTGPKTCEMLCGTPGALEHWSYALPQAMLRQRRPLRAGVAVTVGNDAHVLRLLVTEPTSVDIRHHAAKRDQDLPFSVSAEAGALTFECTPPWACFVQRRDGSIRVDVMRLSGGYAAQLVLDASSHVRARILGDTLVVIDDLGRVVRVNLAQRTGLAFLL